MPFVRRLVLAVLAVWAGAAFAAPPNVLFLAVDDMNDWVGCLGQTPRAITPTIDSLAARGTVFTDAHTAGVFCAPSRAAIFSGQFASTTGCYTTATYFVDHPEIEPLQVSFAKAGYTTLGAGKLFHHPAGCIDTRGWSEFFLRSQRQREAGWPLDSWAADTPFPSPFPNSVYNRGREMNGGMFLEWSALPDDREAEMADTHRVEWAVRQLQQPREKPFFLGVGLYAPHYPNYCPQKYFDLYDRDAIVPPVFEAGDLDDLPERIRKAKIARFRILQRLEDLDAVKDAIHGYLACMSYADAMLGRVLDALEASPHAANTVVVLWSDHGYHHGQKGDWGKHTLWDRTSRVPFIWAGPGIARGQRSDATVSLIDIYPTLVELCGLPPPHQRLEGRSLAGLLAGGRWNERDDERGHGRTVLLPGMRPGEFALINDRWRYIRYGDDGEELYDRRADPRELTNLVTSERHASILEQLRQAAPASFAPPAENLEPHRDLVIEGSTFRWEEGKGTYVPEPEHVPATTPPETPTRKPG
jgi:arylsulfatase A-like enzyme